MAQNLQTDGVVCHQHECQPQRQRQKPKHTVQQLVDFIKHLHPFFVQLRGFHHRILHKIVLQRGNFFRRIVHRFHNERIGQRVCVQHGHNVLLAHRLLHFRQTVRLAHKPHVFHAVFGRQYTLHVVHILLRGRQIHIQRDLRHVAQFVEHRFAALHAQIQRERQRHGNRQHGQNQQRGHRLAEQIHQRAFRTFPMK